MILYIVLYRFWNSTTILRKWRCQPLRITRHVISYEYRDVSGVLTASFIRAVPQSLIPLIMEAVRTSNTSDFETTSPEGCHLHGHRPEYLISHILRSCPNIYLEELRTIWRNLSVSKGSLGRDSNPWLWRNKASGYALRCAVVCWLAYIMLCASSPLTCVVVCSL
jgi:hypothetical protein